MFKSSEFIQREQDALCVREFNLNRIGEESILLPVILNNLLT